MEGPYERLLDRLWETACRGIAGLAAPWQIRRTGQARINVERTRSLVRAQTELDVDALRSGRALLADDGKTLVEGPLDSNPAQEAVRIAERSVVADEMRSQVNVAKALLIAEAELHDDPQEPPDKQVDDDWFFRWRKLAGDVSSEELQSIWGKILAGEIKSPGSFSLRTLDFMKSISIDDASMIEKLAGLVINGECLVHGIGKNTSVAHPVLEVRFLLHMKEIGVIDTFQLGVDSLIRSRRSDRFDNYMRSYTRVLLVQHEDPGKTITLKIYPLTRLGSEIIGIGSFTPDERYLRQIGELIKRAGFSVDIGDITQEDPEGFLVSNTTQL